MKPTKKKTKRRLERDVIKSLNDPKQLVKQIHDTKLAMTQAAANLDFEKAIDLRNKLQVLESYLL